MDLTGFLFELLGFYWLFGLMLTVLDVFQQQLVNPTAALADYCFWPFISFFFWPALLISVHRDGWAWKSLAELVAEEAAYEEQRRESRHLCLAESRARRRR